MDDFMDIQNLRFTRRFLLDLTQKEVTDIIDVKDDPITLLNAIIQTQEHEDWFSSSEEDDEDYDEDDGDGQSGQSREDHETDYPLTSDAFSLSDFLPPVLNSPPKLISVPLLPVPLASKPLALRAVKASTQTFEQRGTDKVDGEKQPIRLFKCGKCVSVFSSQKSLTIHKLQRHMNNPNSGRVRNGNSTVRVNNRVTANGSEPNGLSKYVQEQPSDFYENDQLLVAGMDPKDILKCTYCPRQFPNISTLKVHLNTHTRERPYECQYCQKRFFQSSHLTVHIRTHTGEKPYQCQFCKNAFNSPSNCRVHERTHMKGNEIYQCEECNIGFLHKSRLERHLRSRKHVHPGGIIPRPS